MFSQGCPDCEGIFLATFCGDASCGRKFIPQAGASRERCPEHDPGASDAGSLRRSLSCPHCGGPVLEAREGAAE